MEISPTQRQQLSRALLAAFPSYDELNMMVSFGLDTNLETIAPRDEMSVVVLRLVDWAVANGQLEELLMTASRLNPSSAALAAIVRQVTMEAASKSTSVEQWRLPE